MRLRRNSILLKNDYTLRQPYPPPSWTKPNNNNNHNVNIFVNRTILIGYLATDQTTPSTPITAGSARIISGAMTLAVDRINADSELLNGYTLRFIFADDRADKFIAADRMTRLWKRGALAFFGPENYCRTEASLAAAWNLPIFSYKCNDHRLSDKKQYPTFVRTASASTQITKSIIAVLEAFKWRKFSIVYGDSEPHNLIFNELKVLAEERNMTVNSVHKFESPYVPNIHNNPYRNIIEESKKETRIYVLLGNHDAMIDFMAQMETEGLTQINQYGVIYTHLQVEANFDDGKYFRYNHDLPTKTRIESAVKSLLIIRRSTPSLESFEKDFARKVVEYNHKEPFNFPDLKLNLSSPFGFNMPIFNEKFAISVQAANLYDSVLLYAKSLTESLNLLRNSALNGTKHNNNNNNNCSGAGSTSNSMYSEEWEALRDGKFVAELSLNKYYKSVRGFDIFINEKGDAEGNYTVLAMDKSAYELEAYNVTRTISMRSIGSLRYFKVANTSKLKFQLHRQVFFESIRDEPKCGFHNELCVRVESHIKEIILGFFGVIFIISGLVVLLVYRNRRYEQEIEGLLWRIDPHEITGLRRSSITSEKSIDSRVSHLQIFIQTSTYKGQVVALKRFEKQHQQRRGHFELIINRLLKKEMKTMRDLRHDNLNLFIGAYVGDDEIVLVGEYCSKGSLQDVLFDENMKLDEMFISSLISDLIRAMIFLHGSELKTHGNLKSTNCLVTSRWVLQVADYGLHEIRAEKYKNCDEYNRYKNLLWTAPEHLRLTPPRNGTQKGDVYAFGIILYEIENRSLPYDLESLYLTPKQIIERVSNLEGDEGGEYFRPNIDNLICTTANNNPANDHVIKSTMKECWHQLPDSRPDFVGIRTNLSGLLFSGGKKTTNIFSNMLKMMEKYQENLELLVAERTDQLIDEKKKTESLLYRMLPISVAKQLIAKKAVVPETFACVSIYFSDICGFTPLCAASSPLEVVALLNDLYTLFDGIIGAYCVYKVETIGDAYMVVSGLPERIGDNHGGEIASMSLDLLSAIKTFKIRHFPNERLMLRIGIHSGSCVSGVVGVTMPRYCLFGDTVNTASRMESNGEALKIHMSNECRQVLDKLGGYEYRERGEVFLKGKGSVMTYWLLSEERQVRNERLKSFSFSSQQQLNGPNLFNVMSDLPKSNTLAQRKRQVVQQQQPSNLIPNGRGLSSMDRLVTVSQLRLFEMEEESPV